MPTPYLPILTIAGSDSGGGAGIQADLKAIAACGGYGATAITALTAQNTLGVQAVYTVPRPMIEAQIRSVFDDIAPAAVKIGMLPTAEVIRLVASLLREYQPRWVVLDPVLVATSGDALTTETTRAALLEELVPLATVVTPNLSETGILAGTQNFEQAWQALARAGAQAVLFKAGHAGGDLLTDVLYMPEAIHSFPHPRIDTPNTHGTGCTLSSALAAHLAQGITLPEAARRSIDYLQRALAAGADRSLGRGHGPVDHFPK